MPVHTLSRNQVVPATRVEAWAFFSNPLNLARITPPEMGFEVTAQGLPGAIYPGLMIAYRVRPLLGMPLTWLTEITQVREGSYFVDEQRLGPYRVWHHEHAFRELPQGNMEITDRVTYALPLGPLGEVAHTLLVRKTLEHIFDYRERAIRRLFPG